MKKPYLKKTGIISNGYSFVAVHHIMFDGEYFPIVSPIFSDIDLHCEAWRKREANSFLYESFDFGEATMHEMFERYRQWKNECFMHYCGDLDRFFHDLCNVKLSSKGRELISDIRDGYWSNKDREVCCS